jgi:hypothetical protein
MTTDHHLYRAQAALSVLGHIVCCYNEESEMAPFDFGFGLSVILSYIEGDVTAAYDEITKPKEKAE